MFDKTTYIERRKTLKSKISSGIAIFPGNDEAPMNYEDNTYHYRQDSSFLYYFGVDRPGLVGVIDFDENKDYIFGDDFTIEDFVWMGPQPAIKELSANAGIEYTSTINSLADFLDKIKNQKRKIHFLPPYRDEHRVKIFNWLGIHPEDQAGQVSIELITNVGNQRNIKSQEEIEQIEEAVNTTVDMNLAAMHYARPGMTEAQVAARVHEVALAAGGNISFPIIATIHGETLHNHYHGNIIRSGDLFLLDAGAENKLRYSGDMSSTFPVDKKFTTRQKEIYQIALNAHEAAISILKPGVNFKEAHLLAAKTIVEGLKDMGFMKGNIEDAVARGAHALFFPCGTGHLMGLDVHDMENLGEQYVGYAGEPKSKQFGLKSLRLGRKLEPGFVVTIEPGIYFIPQLIDIWKAENKFKDFIVYDKVEEYKDFSGCRNEEDILITESGYRILGKPLPKTIEDVEKERSRAF